MLTTDTELFMNAVLFEHWAPTLFAGFACFLFVWGTLDNVRLDVAICVIHAINSVMIGDAFGHRLQLKAGVAPSIAHPLIQFDSSVIAPLPKVNRH